MVGTSVLGLPPLLIVHCCRRRRRRNHHCLRKERCRLRFCYARIRFLLASRKGPATRGKFFRIVVVVKLFSQIKGFGPGSIHRKRQKKPNNNNNNNNNQTKPKWADSPAWKWLYTDLTSASVSKKSAPRILRLLRVGGWGGLVLRGFFLGGIWVSDMKGRRFQRTANLAKCYCLPDFPSS